MALTAKFLADFTSFYSAVDKATTQLDGFKAEAEAAGLSVSRMTESLSGKKLLNEALTMSAAVDAIGGASKLTTAELEKVSNKAAEAVEKASRLGIDVPPQLQKLADAQKETSSAFDLSTAAVANFAAGFLTLNVAWKLVKEGFRAVVDFFEESITIAQKAGGAGADAITAFGKSWTALQLAVGQSILQNQTVITTITALSQALSGSAGDLTTNRATMNLVSDAVILLVRSFGLLLEGLSTTAKFFQSTLREMRVFSQGVLALINVFLRAAQALAPYNAQMAATAKELEAARGVVQGFSDKVRAAEDFTTDFVRVTGDLGVKTHALAEQLAATRGQTVALTTAQQQSTASAKQAKEEATALATAQKAAEAETARHEAAQRKFQESISRSGSGMATAIPIVQSYTNMLDGLLRGTDDVSAALMQSQIHVDAAGKAIRVDLLPAVESLGPELADAATGVESFGTTLKDYFAKDFGQTVVKAIQGGGNVISAALTTLGNKLFAPNSPFATSISTGIGKLFGPEGVMGHIGGMLSGLIPMIGSVMGPAVQYLGGLISGLWDHGEEEKFGAMRGEFLKLQGGLESLNPRVLTLSGNLALVQAVLDAKTVDEYNAAIGNLTKLFEEEQSALDDVTKTAEKYGLTLEELGPALQRQGLEKKAKELYKDWQVLNSAGIDTVAITKRMASEINQYVSEARKMGSEIPSAMKPMLEKMIEMGELTDDSGNKIEDLEGSGISFSRTMSEGFRDLISEVQRLTDLIGRSLGTALDSTKKKVEAIPDKITIDVEYNEDDRPTAGGSVPGYQHGTRGKFLDFGAGTLAMLHGREAIVPESAMRGTTSGGGAGGALGGVTIVVNAQGSFFDTPGDLQRLAAKVNDALTAKYGQTNRLRAA